MKFLFWKKSREEKISQNEMYIPHEILDQKNKNTDVQNNKPNVYEKDGYLVKEYDCGCIFKTTIKSFGYNNHYCNNHAPSYPMERPIGLGVSNEQK